MRNASRLYSLMIVNICIYNIILVCLHFHSLQYLRRMCTLLPRIKFNFFTAQKKVQLRNIVVLYSEKTVKLSFGVKKISIFRR